MVRFVKRTVLGMIRFLRKDNFIMKIKHKKLELVKQNPKDIKNIISEGYSGGPNMTRCWDRAISFYHKENDINRAILYLQNLLSTFADSKRNRDKTEFLIKQLIGYHESYEKLKVAPFKVLGRLNMDIGFKNYLTGEIYRVDKTETGYAVTLMMRTVSLWKHELRFPLIQRHFSIKLKCDESEIRVGMYNFEKSEHEYITYDHETLENAWSEVLSISEKINSVA